VRICPDGTDLADPAEFELDSVRRVPSRPATTQVSGMQLLDALDFVDQTSTGCCVRESDVGIPMTRDDVLDRCSALPGAIEDYPFGDDVAVFKIGGKMFALVMLTGEPGFVNLKCDPDLALELRAQYPAVQPGYHANKRHWNSVTLDGTVDDAELDDMIGHSYDLVLPSLPRREQSRILGT
jgi:predicted DNA-binding protein (MmcQ/YjbR family)